MDVCNTDLASADVIRWGRRTLRCCARAAMTTRRHAAVDLIFWQLTRCRSAHEKPLDTRPPRQTLGSWRFVRGLGNRTINLTDADGSSLSVPDGLGSSPVWRVTRRVEKAGEPFPTRCYPRPACRPWSTSPENPSGRKRDRPDGFAANFSSGPTGFQISRGCCGGSLLAITSGALATVVASAAFTGST